MSDIMMRKSELLSRILTCMFNRNSLISWHSKDILWEGLTFCVCQFIQFKKTNHSIGKLALTLCSLPVSFMSGHLLTNTHHPSKLIARIFHPLTLSKSEISRKCFPTVCIYIKCTIIRRVDQLLSLEKPESTSRERINFPKSTNKLESKKRKCS